MEFKIDHSILKKAITEVSHAVSSKTAIPILTGIKIEAKLDRLIVTGSNSDFIIERIVPVENNEVARLDIIETGSVVLSAKYLTEIIKKLPKDIYFKADENQTVIIQSGEIVTKMSGLNQAEYPSLPDNNANTIVTITSNDLIDMLKQTVFAASNHETNPVLTGVNFSFQQGLLTCIATNSHRLSLKRKKVNTNVNESFIVPSSSVSELIKLFGTYTTDIVIIATNTTIVCKSDTLSFYSRLIEGNYPNISGLISQQPNTIVTMNTKQLLEGIDRATVFASEWRNNNIKFEIDENQKLVISSRHSEMGQIKEKQYMKDISGEEELSVTINGSFMIEALKAIKTNEVQLCFNGSMRPILIHPIGDDTHVQLISPVRTY
ncbi:DNA polymerase III subunit beta [Ornithinibacillus halotolerans]|uniref:Beta sliding clamp n=1 Tax=Ornithinibacillus halotolerans TaxID=1274357 RepID=A0A916S622_9BACI|nr:DNA polymerase III subunit beta [Ornithinibacillus halotolerans]GGA82790.1 DNA polymerase III subunit beta [Ornithinibacillus halotolerans]